MNPFTENKHVHYEIIIIVGIILSIPLSNLSIMETRDGLFHFLRLGGTANAFKIKQIPPLIMPYLNHGEGYGFNFFYNPLVTYFPLVIKLFTPTYVLALKIFAGLCIVLSGLTMYNFAKNITKDSVIALFSAILYLIAPYKLGDIYRRYAMGEFGAFIFTPILFSGIYNLLNQDGKKHYLIAIGAIGLILTHTLTTFYIAIFSVCYILFHFIKLKDKQIIKKLLINVIFIVLISFFFITPMLEAKFSAEYGIFDNEIMLTNSKYVYLNTLNFNRLFFDGVYHNLDTVLSLGIPSIILFVLSVVIFFYVDKKYKKSYTIFFAFSIVSVYMSTKYCLWAIFPDFLCKLQYPWRMLGFYNFFCSFVGGVNMAILLKVMDKKKIAKFTIAYLSIIVMIIYTIPIVTQFKTKSPYFDQSYEKAIINSTGTQYINIPKEYLPVKAYLLNDTYLKERDYNKIYILKGNAEIVKEEKKDLSMTANIENIEEDTILEFPFLYYPGYEVSIIKLNENKELNKKCIETEHGFAGIQLKEKIDKAQIKFEFKSTIITKISYFISLIALIVFIFYIIRQKRNVK